MSSVTYGKCNYGKCNHGKRIMANKTEPVLLILVDNLYICRKINKTLKNPFHKNYAKVGVIK